MKTEDFKRLKKLCDENGFELVTESPKENDKFFVVKKKDKWEGIEFFEVFDRIYKMTEQANKYFLHTYDKSIHTNECKPSTEEAYVDQLKKEAFDRFGEIKEGHKFFTSFDNATFTIDLGEGFYYNKISDVLFFNGWSIYKQGKWAERVKERVKIKELHMTRISKNWGQITFKLSQDIDLDLKCGDFISQQLEKYLNNEI